MQILITDVTGAIGRPLARRLLAAGHTVSGVAGTPHDYLDADVDFVCAPLTDPVLDELAGTADAVIHLAPIETALPGGAGSTGLVRVTHAAARAGARLLLPVPATGRPEVYQPAQELVSSGWAPSLVIRMGPPLGRQLDWMVCRTVASLLRTRASSQTLRLLHLDDLIRFLVGACDSDRTGVVDLATSDTVDLTTVHRLLRAAARPPAVRRLPGWPCLAPELDVSALQDDWGFECGWPAADAVADTGRGLAGRRLTTGGALDASGHPPVPLEPGPRWEPLDGAALYCAAPDGLEGEFDDRIDPRFPVFSAAGLAGALPGPLTPMTLDVQVSGLRLAARVIEQVTALPRVVAGEWNSRGVAVFGHRPYLGVSASAIVAAQLPGWDGSAVTERALGERVPTLAPVPADRPDAATRAVVLARALSLLRNLKADTEAYCGAAVAAHVRPSTLAGLSDARLEVRIGRLREWISAGWGLIARWVIDNGVTAATVARTGGPDTGSGLGTLTESERIAADTAPIAEVLRRSPDLYALAERGDLAGIRAVAPGLAADIDATAARLAHRGPGEAELANPVFGDDPAMLLRAVLAAVAADPVAPPVANSTTLAQRMAVSTRSSREAAHDATMRFTHELRLALREIAARHLGTEVIDAAADVYYLTCDEVLTMPTDARLRIKRRRVERERLQAIRLPVVFEHTWTPVPTRAAVS